MNNNKFEFMTVHKRLCFNIIKRIVRRCKQNYYFDDVKVCLTKRIIVDGNHRYIAYLIAGIKFDVIKSTSSNCDNPIDYSTLEVDFSNDWDVHQYKYRKYIDDGEWLEEFRRN